MVRQSAAVGAQIQRNEAVLGLGPACVRVSAQRLSIVLCCAVGIEGSSLTRQRKQDSMLCPPSEETQPQGHSADPAQSGSEHPALEYKKLLCPDGERYHGTVLNDVK